MTIPAITIAAVVASYLSPPKHRELNINSACVKSCKLSKSELLVRSLITYMHKCSRDDDAGTELLDHGHDDTTTLVSAEREDYRSKYTDGCRGENGEHKTNS